MIIKRIVTADALKEIFKFRREVLVEECGYLPDMGDSIWDVYDKNAHNYAAYIESGKIIGAIRIVVDSPIGLPVERLCSLKKHRPKKLLSEACRFVIAKEYRSSRLFIKLITAAYQCALHIGCSHLVLDTYLVEEPLYRRLGFQRISEPYSDPECNRNALVVAMIARVSEKSVYLIKNPSIQNAILSVQSEDIYHGELTKQRTALEELSIYQ